MAGAAEKVIAFVLRLLVGGAFIYAGSLKALDPAGFAQAVDNFRLLPYPLSCAIGVYLPWLEILAGAALVIGIFRAGATLLLGGLLVAFLVVLASAWARGLDISCGCFGHSTGNGHLWKSIVLDIAILTGLIFATIASRASSRPRDPVPPVAGH